LGSKNSADRAYRHRSAGGDEQPLLRHQAVRVVSEARHQYRVDFLPWRNVGLRALFAGDIHFATSDGVAGLSANLRGANLYFIAGMINTFPFSILSRPEIRTPQDLRGKKIVISRYGSSSDTAVRAAVEKYNLRPDKDVIILQGGGQSERFAALKVGAVEAAIVSPAVEFSREKDGV